MVVLNKIYTRTGDDGTTALGSGRRVAKYDLRVEAYGTLDETNAAIGIAACTRAKPFKRSMPCWRASKTICSISAPTSAFPTRPRKRAAGLRVTDAQVDRLEGEIDELNKELQPLRSFVLPGGSAAASYLHLARTISRRAERLMVALAARARRAGGRAVAALRQSPVGFPVRRRALRERQGQGRRDMGAGQEPVTREEGCFRVHSPA